MTQAQVLSVPSVSLIEGRPATTSLDIAEHYTCPEEFNARNFAEVEYMDAKGEKRPCIPSFSMASSSW